MKQAELTQAQRLAAYIKVRDNLIELGPNCDMVFICFQLQDIIGCDRSDKVFAFFPELKLFEPVENTDKIWSLGDMFSDEPMQERMEYANEARLFVAQLLIEMTRP